MPRRVKSKSAANNKISNTVKLLRQLKRPVIYVPALMVLGIIVYFGLQQYRSTRERGAFNKIEQKTTHMIESVTQSSGVPLYNDEAHTCFMRAPEEFSGKKLFCSTTTILYYKVDPNNARQFAMHAKRSLEDNFGVTLSDAADPKDQQSVGYEFGSHILSSFGDISCAMSIEYPAGLQGGVDVPSRDFTNDSVMAIGISCDKQVVKAIYSMVKR